MSDQGSTYLCPGGITSTYPYSHCRWASSETHIYKASLALNDNKSVSIMCVVSGARPHCSPGWVCSHAGGLHCSILPPGFREVVATGGGK